MVKPLVWLLVLLWLAALVTVPLWLSRRASNDPAELPSFDERAEPCPTEPAQRSGPPVLTDSLAATIAGQPVRVRGCGLAGIESVRAALNGSELQILDFDDTRVVVDIPADARSGDLAITFDGDQDGTPQTTLPLEVYRYRSIPLPATPGTAPRALAVVVDDAQRVWVNQEFHRSLHRIENGNATAFEIPIPETPPFATTNFGDRLTGVSALGEDIVIGPAGGVWFTQGGGSLYRGNFANHSRIVRFDPDTERFAVYDVPGTNNEVIGLDFDAEGTVWFAQAGRDQGAIINFDPAAVTPSNTTNELLDPALDQFCDDVAAGCFRAYPLARTNSHPAHLIIADDAVWFTEFFGDSISRLDIDTATIVTYPFARTLGSKQRTVGAGPWQLYLEEGSGQIIFNEFFDNRVVYFDTARAEARPEQCRRVNSDSGNRCSASIEVSSNLDEVNIHSIAPGRGMRTWFSMQTAVDGTPTSVGFVHEREEVHVLPELKQVDPNAGGGQAGIAIDPVTGDIWFAEFSNNSVGQLRLQ